MIVGVDIGSQPLKVAVLDTALHEGPSCAAIRSAILGRVGSSRIQAREAAWGPRR
jgi:hypothetical protein